MNQDLMVRSINTEPLKSVFESFALANKDIEQGLCLSAKEIIRLMKFTTEYLPSAQSNFDDDSRYYEQIIFEDKQIPTRDDSWHDFFNALIWSEFPTCKAYLNHLHMVDIKAHGVHPRTKLRNKITLLDECGVIVLTTNKELKHAFEQQNWQAIFLNSRVSWFENTMPYMFGHAIYESLLQPFIGLTGKAMIIEVASIETINKCKDKHYLDALVLEYLQQSSVFEKAKPFFPLPILGVPTWYSESQDTEFYANTDYFMPKRKAK